MSKVIDNVLYNLLLEEKLVQEDYIVEILRGNKIPGWVSVFDMKMKSNRFFGFQKPGKLFCKFKVLGSFIFLTFYIVETL